MGLYACGLVRFSEVFREYKKGLPGSDELTLVTTETKHEYSGKNNLKIWKKVPQTNKSHQVCMKVQVHISSEQPQEYSLEHML